MSKDTNKKEKKEQKNNFMKELKLELKKVTWPSRKDLVTNTATVIFITIIIAAIVFVLDFSFEKLNTYGVEKLKSVVTASESSEENTEIIEDNTINQDNAETEATNQVTTENTEGSTDQNQVTEDTTNTTAE